MDMTLLGQVLEHLSFFVKEDGTCDRNHFCDIFALEPDLPDEIKNAKMVEDLTPEQRENFLRSVKVV